MKIYRQKKCFKPVIYASDSSKAVVLMWVFWGAFFVCCFVFFLRGVSWWVFPLLRVFMCVCFFVVVVFSVLLSIAEERAGLYAARAFVSQYVYLACVNVCLFVFFLLGRRLAVDWGNIWTFNSFTFKHVPPCFFKVFSDSLYYDNT